MVVEHVLDARRLSPPEPFVRAIEAARSLEEGECIVMLHRREPFPLYAALAELGCEHRTQCVGEDEYRVLIWRRGDEDARRHCEGRT